jgi:hypothetical protein
VATGWRRGFGFAEETVAVAVESVEVVGRAVEFLSRDLSVAIAVKAPDERRTSSDCGAKVRGPL